MINDPSLQFVKFRLQLKRELLWERSLGMYQAETQAEGRAEQDPHRHSQPVAKEDLSMCLQQLVALQTRVIEQQEEIVRRK